MINDLNTSYEGFRRKNSVNGLRLDRNIGSESFLMKLNLQDELDEVQNLSAQLQNFSRRSISSQKYKETSGETSKSPRGLNMLAQDKVSQKRKQQIKKLKQLEYQDNVSTQKYDKKNQTTITITLENIQTIEETTSHKQEESDDTPPKVVQNSPAKVTLKKVVSQKILRNVNPQRKNINSNKLNAFNKQERIKIQINELDKMQNDLLNKKNNKDKIVNKVNAIPIKPRKEIQLRQTIATIKQRVPVWRPQKKVNSPRNDEVPMQLEIHSKKKLTEPNYKQAQFYEKTKQAQSYQNILGEQTERAKDQMKATKMITIKQKQILLCQLKKLEEIIHNNEICSENLEEIKKQFVCLAKLITK